MVDGYCYHSLASLLAVRIHDKKGWPILMYELFVLPIYFATNSILALVANFSATKKRPWRKRVRGVTSVSAFRWIGVWCDVDVR